MADPLYLDFNATTPLLPEVVDAMLPFLREHFGNPSSGHVYGQRAKAAVANAREQVAALLHCAPGEVLFTSGGTEANNLALVGLWHARRFHGLVTSVVEHPATSAPVQRLEREGAPVTRMPVDDRGVAVLPGAVDGPVLASLMHANNETGVLQPVSGLARLVHASGGLVHTDASQTVGKLAVDVRELDVDALTVCAHKLYAPKGVGALYVRDGVVPTPVLLGASHERGLRPGTENVASIVGLGVACEVARRTLAAEAARVTALRDALHEGLVSRVPSLVVNGAAAPRLPNTLSVRFPGVSGSDVLAQAPGLAASTGSACHDGHETASAVILAMGVSPTEAAGTVRLSLGRSTSVGDIAFAAEHLAEAWRRVTERSRA
ncbi:MAG: cysteine desulfurase family protein [Myxococcaceae bacterium]|nr:cysteine desulfurase family protein [Myxococcaceae bacterium]